MLTANIDRYIKYNNKKNTTTLTSLRELQQSCFLPEYSYISQPALASNYLGSLENEISPHRLAAMHALCLASSI